MQLLRESSPDWVSRIGRGANWLFVGLLLSMCTASLAERVPFAGPIIDLLPDVAFFVGIWMLTTPEPGRSHPGSGWRRLARIVCVPVVAFDVVVATSGYIPNLHLLPFRGAALMLGGVQLLCIAFYLAELASRIPDMRLAGQSRFVVSGLAIIGLFAGGGVVYVDRSNSALEAVRGDSIVLVAAVPLVLGTIILSFWSLWILHRFQKRIAGETIQARLRPTKDTDPEPACHERIGT